MLFIMKLKSTIPPILMIFMALLMSSCGEDEEVTGFISGTVTGIGAAIEGAQIIVYNANTNAPTDKSTKSDVSGNYTLELVGETYFLKVYANGFNPNPGSGAPIPVVVKNGEELGRGYHRVAGGPHAERMAIESAKSCRGAESLLGACLYVTLEPCSTHGRTGACTEAVLAEGIDRLVFGAEDPNPAHAGRGADILRGQGVEVVSGVEEVALAFIQTEV